ncbi:sugar ABC transporter ATP-binding protein [Ammoniphilus sp. YIM 78166]|uniref:sugar ABC transporter ATP-binding protein n=1 Tax=Ammoniphilus sp. YIM 78166 TaxID=1644106 RepID=UPI001430B3AE|nr:sugar ABC transporter ATP-binding protein [Ammoniphilus sp. YIM 78166]
MIFKMENISKSFFGNKVLDQVNFELKSGEVHALIGGNGAGKSTLVHIASGMLEPDNGKFYLNDRQVAIHSPLDAKKLGISVIHQNPSLIPDMSVAENIFLGTEPRLLKIFVYSLKMNWEAKRILKLLGVSINPNKLVRYTSQHEQYLISIAKSICQKSKILIMDEPTAGLTENERINLFKLINMYKSQGVGIIYISHRLDEISKICDRVTILRDGKHIVTSDVQNLPEKDMVKLMFGRDAKLYFPPILKSSRNELLKVENLTKRPLFNNVNFTLYEGEILGIAGLAGSGKSELAKTIFGHKQRDSGNIFWRQQEVVFNHPIQAVNERFGYVNENRLTSGLMMNMSVRNNLSISSLKKLNRWQFVKVNEEMDESLQNVIDLDIKLSHVDQKVKYLSGGNQQKVMLGRWLMADSAIYLLDEPTKGIDVASRSDLYLKIHELAEQGKGVLIISSDIQELLGLCHRILVMNQGCVIGSLPNHNLTEQKIVQLMNAP